MEKKKFKQSDHDSWDNIKGSKIYEIGLSEGKKVEYGAENHLKKYFQKLPKFHQMYFICF